MSQFYPRPFLTTYIPITNSPVAELEGSLFRDRTQPIRANFRLCNLEYPGVEGRIILKWILMK